jgi:hypothetical protein
LDPVKAALPIQLAALQEQPPLHLPHTTTNAAALCIHGQGVASQHQQSPVSKGKAQACCTQLSVYQQQPRWQ